jgi:hypothetical protein
MGSVECPEYRTPGVSISFREHHARGLAPIFTGSGFIKPDHVQLIRDGRYQDCLVSSRSAMEYDSVTNADYEFPGSLELATGELSSDDILKQLDTGLHINNLWCLNFSDHNAFHVTGMTRFACFWVEQGEIAVNYRLLNDMRNQNSSAIDSTFNESSQGKFHSISAALFNDLPAASDALGTVTSIEISDDIAEIAVTRAKNGQPHNYYIYLVRTEQGYWTIDDM